ncbi:MAG: metallophosphoesterase family protein [Crenarchaeota archaeon]|nr:metallophosphoesterase family protein [Thermoproteota archaeon]
MAASNQTQIPTVIPKIKPEKIIGLISDTHVPTRAECIPKEIAQVFENVDYIIHAGDLVELSVIDELDQIAPVLAVHGNMDTPETVKMLPKLNSLKLFDWKIGVAHDPSMIHELGKIKDIIDQNKFNVFVNGHTHRANIKWEEGTLFINPGSPINPDTPFTKATVALLKITKESILPEIVQL